MTDSIDVRAAEIVLGLRKPEAAGETSGDMLDFWVRALAPLSGEAVPPAALFERISTQIDRRGLEAPGSVTRRADDRQWKAVAPGIEMTTLRVDAARREKTTLFRFAPGAVLDGHAHDDDEELFVIEGDLSFGSIELGRGDYHMAAKGWRHPRGTTRNGCLCLIILRQAA
jgi:mannose-6-phosphate isomerase-like protein (cupin superfamily)